MTIFFRKKMPVLFALVLCVMIFSCNQDSIFYAISIDQEPEDARVPGGPTQIIFQDLGGGKKMYVGSHRNTIIHVFDGQSWDSFDTPDKGKLGGIAAGKDNGGKDCLFVLTYPNGDPLKSAAVHTYKQDGTWTKIPNAASADDYNINTIYAAGDKIFAGAQNKSDLQDYAILYYNNTTGNELTLWKENTSLLTGAAEISPGGEIFLATAGEGIFKYDDSTQVPVADTENANIRGIIATGGVIVAVSSDGNSSGSVYIYDSSLNKFTKNSHSVIYTGAMCVWQNYVADDGWKPALLLLGIHGEGTSLVHGYRELKLTADGKPDSATNYTITQPGSSESSSVDNGDRYAVTIGKYPINHIVQVPPDFGGVKDMTLPENDGWQPTIFASTQREGLWSYKLRDGKWTWNAE